jgi:hypothetical protein
MEKIILSGSFNIDDPAVQLAELHSRGVDKGWLQKRAAVLTKEIAEVRPTPGKSYFHLIAMGDSETYSCNRNADGFKKKANVERHHTFVTNGHVFKNHVNHDPKLASGSVKASAYNPTMARTELLIEVDEKKWEPELTKLANGEDLKFSMSCRLPYDVCQICNNKAPSRANYCECMKKYAGRMLDDGRLVYVDNPNPTFFDISGVGRPADRIAYHLEKVASATGPVETGADLAELLGISSTPSAAGLCKYSSMRWDKQEMLRKLAEMEKEISGFCPADQNLALAVNDADAPVISEEDMGTLRGKELDKIISALGNAQISLPVRDFIRLVSDGTAPAESEVKAKLPGIFGRMLEEDGGEGVCSDGTYDPLSSGLNFLPQEVKSIIERLVPDFGMGEGPATGRIQIAIIRKKPTAVLKSSACLHSISVDKTDCNAELWAREYAKYKLAFLTKAARCEGGSLVLRLGILQNHV